MHKLIIFCKFYILYLAKKKARVSLVPSSIAKVGVARLPSLIKT